MPQMRRFAVVHFDRFFNCRRDRLNAAENDWHNHFARIQTRRINAHWCDRPNSQKLFGILRNKLFNVRKHHNALIRPISENATNKVRNNDRLSGSCRHCDDGVSDPAALEIVEY